MRRSYGFGGWDTTSNDYHAHLARIERTPSVLPDVPQYPTVHKAFTHNSYAYGEEQGDQQQTKKSSQKAHKKVQMNEHVDIVESAATNNNFEVQEGSIDTEAEGFIKQKRKGFELCKWKTFKM